MARLLRSLRVAEPMDSVLRMGEVDVPVHEGFVRLVSPFLRRLFEEQHAVKRRDGLPVREILFESCAGGRSLDMVISVVYGETIADMRKRMEYSETSPLWVYYCADSAVLADALCIDFARDEFLAVACQEARVSLVGAHLVLARLGMLEFGEATEFSSLRKVALASVRKGVSRDAEMSLWPYRAEASACAASEVVSILRESPEPYKHWLLNMVKNTLSSEVQVKLCHAFGLVQSTDTLRGLTCEELMRCWRAGALTDEEMIGLGRNSSVGVAHYMSRTLSVLPFSYPREYKVALEKGWCVVSRDTIYARWDVPEFIISDFELCVSSNSTQRKVNLRSTHETRCITIRAASLLFGLSGDMPHSSCRSINQVSSICIQLSPSGIIGPVYALNIDNVQEVD